MSWKRVLLQNPEPVKSPGILRWGFALLLVIVCSVFLAVLNEEYTDYYFPRTRSAYIIAAFLLFFLFALMARVGVFLHMQSRYQFMLMEKRLSDEAWAQWGGRYVGSLMAVTLLPNSVTSSFVLDSSGNHEVFNGQPIRIDHIQGLSIGGGIKFLIEMLQDKLPELHAIFPLDVFVLSDRQNLENIPAEFVELWNNTNLVTRFELSDVVALDSLSFGVIEDWLSSDDGKLKLVLVEQLFGNNNYSDALSAMLFATDDLCRNMGMNSVPRLNRPMHAATELTVKKLDIFFLTQAIAKSTFFMLINSVSAQKHMPVLHEYMFENSLQLKPERQYVLEYFMGLTGPFSCWITASMGLDVTQAAQKPGLLFIGEGNNIWMATVVAGGAHE